MDASPINSVALTGIVLEPVSRANYNEWRALVKNYLAGQDLWDDVVEVGSAPHHDNPNWKSKNAKALHAIQLSCGYPTLPYISQCDTAKEAWNILIAVFGPTNLRLRKRIEINDIEQGLYASSEHNVQNLHNAVRNGLWNEAESIIRRDPDLMYCTITSNNCRTLLHTAVVARQDEIVKKLLRIWNDRLLLLKDAFGYTALALVAQFSKNIEIAGLMISRGGIQLLAEENRDGEIPVLIASAQEHKEMTRYLFYKTPRHFLMNENNDFRYASVLLARCISAQIFDVAATLIEEERAGHLDPDESYCALARVPSAFLSGTQLSFTHHFIYILTDMWIKKMEVDCKDRNIVVEPHDGSEEGTNAYILTGIREIYKMNKKHCLVLEILNYLCLRIAESSENEQRRSSAEEAMLLAAKNGIVEFIDSMGKANPDLLLAVDSNRRGLLANAILNRQEKVFNLLLGVKGHKEIVASHHDEFGNNILHLAAELGTSSTSGGKSKSSSTLRMLRELQWFKAVESIVPRTSYENKNELGFTPRELFSMNHTELVKDSRQWLKETSNTSITFGTVIITLMFAAAITVPGGNDQNKGTPMFLGERAFTLFAIADAISLITSLSSVLSFMAIVTSSLAEEDFMKSLPLKLFFGFGFLLCSVLSMMCAFYAALISMLKGYRWIIIAALGTTVIPISVLIPSILRLSITILRFAIKSGFHTTKKIKSHRL